MTSFEIFELRCRLTSKLILHYKDKNCHEYNTISTLIKSDLYEDLILAEEIIKQLAI